MVVVVFKSAFRLKMHINNIFLFFKFIFNINTWKYKKYILKIKNNFRAKLSDLK